MAKKTYRIVEEWCTRKDIVNGTTKIVGPTKYYIEYRTIWTILFGETWVRPLEYCSGFNSEKDALAEIEGLTREQEKITTHKRVVWPID